MITRKLASLAVLVAAFLSTGCPGMSNTGKGALVGAGVGTGIGALAGGPRGALVGAAVGTLAGGVVGNDMDQQERREKDRRLAIAEARADAATLPPPAAPMGIADVLQLTKDQTPDHLIINQIRSSGSTFTLSVEDLRLLQANNVSPRVIEEMQNRRPVTRVIREPHYVYPAREPVVIYESYPPRPRPYASVGVYTRLP